MIVLIEKQSDDAQKWIISFVSAIIFMLVAAPYTYELTNKLVAQPLGLKFLSNGGVTPLGLIIHSLVFFFIVRIMMW